MVCSTDRSRHYSHPSPCIYTYAHSADNNYLVSPRITLRKTTSLLIHKYRIAEADSLITRETHLIQTTELLMDACSFVGTFHNMAIPNYVLNDYEENACYWERWHILTNPPYCLNREHSVTSGYVPLCIISVSRTVHIYIYIYKLLFQTRLTRIHAQWSIENNTW